MSSKKNKVVADVVLSKENISLIVENVVSCLLNGGVLNSQNLNVVDSESVKADKKKVDLCYKKLVAKEKVEYCKPYKLILNNLNLLKKDDKEKFLKLHQACLDNSTLENNQKRKDFARKLVKDFKKYPKLNQLYIDGCTNFKNYKNKGAKK